jgi:hypothetical protein
MSVLAGLVIFGGAPLLGVVLGVCLYRRQARRLLNGKWNFRP